MTMYQLQRLHSVELKIGGVWVMSWMG